MTGDREALLNLRHTHQGRRSSLLVHTNDLGREYDAEDREPKILRTSEVMEEFRDWLKVNVLDYILTFTEQEPLPDTTPALTPFPTDKVGSIFTYCEYRDAERILTGQRDLDSLPASERYGMIGSGYRLVSLDVRNDGTLSEKAYDGFMWCAIGEVSSKSKLEKLPKEIGRFYRWDDRHRNVIRVTPKFAEGVYFADMGPAERYRADIFKKNRKQRELTNEQYAEYLRMPGRTIVPVSEYAGGYEKPVVLVNRELDFDEVEVVLGPALEKVNS